MVHLKKLRLDILGGQSLNKVYSSFDKETEFTKVNPVQLLTSGKITKDDIGRTVYLSNSRNTCQEWRIADINHDGTSGTVDLICKYVLGDSAFGGTSNDYSDSTYREYLNRTDASAWYGNIGHGLLGGFAIDVQNIMKEQPLPEDSRVHDKVKAPSNTELGCNQPLDNGYFSYQQAGSVYPLFGDAEKYPNPLAIFKLPDGSVDGILTRTTDMNYAIGINTSGYTFITEIYGSFSYGYIAIIRF